ncbi:MAG: hypothetical protein MJZ42_04150, partial [Bacteroidales bacterium]|nr:hypothetical protein [Bacteroidales bacterium]
FWIKISTNRQNRHEKSGNKRKFKENQSNYFRNKYRKLHILLIIFILHKYKKQNTKSKIKQTAIQY